MNNSARDSFSKIAELILSAVMISLLILAEIGAFPSSVEDQTWITVLSTSTLLSFVVLARSSWDRARFRFLFTAVTGGFFLYHTICVEVQNEGHVSDWDSIVYSADTETHLVDYTPDASRPPLYSWFARLVTGVPGSVYLREPYTVSVSVKPPADSYYLRIVRAQKLVYCVAVVFFVWAVSALIPAPILAALFSYLFAKGYLTAQYSFLMTEPLAQAWMYLIVGVFALFLVRADRRYLPLLAFFCALLVNTRSAGIYGVAFLLSAIIWCAGTKGIRRTVLPAISSVVLFVALFLGPAMYRYVYTGFFSVAPMYADARIAYALYVAQPEDVALMPDQLAAKFLTESFEEKKKIAAEVKRFWGEPGIGGGWAYLSSNLYLVAHPLVARYGVSAGPQGGANTRDLFLRVSEPILKKHQIAYLKVCLSALLAATGVNTRVHFGSFFTFWPLILASLFCALLVPHRVAWFSLTAIGAHLAHLVVIVRHDQPLLRYIFATEPLMYLGFAALLAGLLERLVQILRFSPIASTDKLIPHEGGLHAQRESQTVTEQQRLAGRLAGRG